MESLKILGITSRKGLIGQTRNLKRASKSKKHLVKNILMKFLLPMVQNELQKITDLKFEVISQDEMTLYIHYPQLLEQVNTGEVMSNL